VRRVAIAAAIGLLVLLSTGCGQAATLTGVATTEHLGGVGTTVPPTIGPTTTTTPPKITGFLAQSASFVTADDGFVLGIVACPKRRCLALHHTADRGARWTSDPAPPTTLDTGGATGVSELHFADAHDGWAYGATVWATRDGARKWHVVKLPGRVVAMASGAGEAYALVEPCEWTPCYTPGHLYRSPVGHDSWTEVPGVSDRYDLGEVSLVAEGRSVFVLAGYPKPEILGSSDGIGFAPLTDPCPTATPGEAVNPSLASLAASGPSDVAVACLGGVAAGNQTKLAYVSHDGGHTYQSLPEPPTGGDGAELAMPAPTSLLLGAASGATLVYRIASPDASWTTPFFVPGGIDVADLAFVDPAHGAFVYGAASVALSMLGLSNPPSGLGALFLSDDGGAHWHRVPIPG
jgi:hypothetical protein